MAKWTVAGHEVTFHDALHTKQHRAIVGVESGPVVDEQTGRTYLYAMAGRTEAIVAPTDKIDPFVPVQKWCAMIRLGDADISGRIYLFASGRTKLLRKLKQYVYVVEHGLNNSDFGKDLQDGCCEDCQAG